MNIKLLLLGASSVVAMGAADLDNIQFVNLLPDKVYVARDKTVVAEVEKYAIECIASKDNESGPYYLYVYTSKPSSQQIGQNPFRKYLILPGRNYRITTASALGTTEKWAQACPPLTAEQLSREVKDSIYIKDSHGDGEVNFGDYRNSGRPLPFKTEQDQINYMTDKNLAPGMYKTFYDLMVIRTRDTQAYNNISFVNDSDKKVYLCRDKDSLGVIEPKATVCYGEAFFKGTFSKPMPRYFKISFSDKPCTENPDVKYALATGKNYRITTQAALKTDEKWFNGCPPLTPAQQTAEAASGGVLEKVVGGSAVLADDIKSGVLKGWDETKGFITNTAPNAVKDAYQKTADFITKDVGNKFSQFGSSIESGAVTAAEKTKQGLEAAGTGIKDVANKAGDWVSGAAGTVKGGFEDFGRGFRSVFGF